MNKKENIGMIVVSPDGVASNKVIKILKILKEENIELIDFRYKRINKEEVELLYNKQLNNLSPYFYLVQDLFFMGYRQDLRQNR